MIKHVTTLEKKDRYDEMYKNFKWHVPEYFNFGFDVVDKWAEDRTKLALISIDRTGKHDRYHTFFDLNIYFCIFYSHLQRSCLKVAFFISYQRRIYNEL